MTVERAGSPGISVEPLADRPDLLTPLARIRWSEWNDHSGREDLQWWLGTTRGESSATGLPVTLVAVDAAGEVVGGVGLIPWEPQEFPELAGRGPWVVGTIVRADRRGQGIGAALMLRLTRWAAAEGIDRLWVATGGRAIDFYRQCGFTVTGVVQTGSGDQPTILTIRLTSQP